MRFQHFRIAPHPEPGVQPCFVKHRIVKGNDDTRYREPHVLSKKLP